MESEALTISLDNAIRGFSIARNDPLLVPVDSSFFFLVANTVKSFV